MCGSISNRAERLVPISSGTGSEWLPTFGESWHVVQVPLMIGWLTWSLSPRTFVMRSGCVLKISSPRATDLLYGSRDCFHFEYSVKALGSNAPPVGFPPNGSLIPAKNSVWLRSQGPPVAP